ncbi:MAG: RNase adapter RapZ [Pseudomonadota bacterium]
MAVTDIEAAGPDAGLQSRRPVILVTGLAGAGMSTALKSLEDLGYEAVDNLPLGLMPILIGAPGANARPLAIGIDGRTRGFAVDALLAEVERLRHRSDVDVRLLYLTCDADVLQRRFTETRRRHPLALDRPIADGIKADIATTARLADQADPVIDTSSLTIKELRQLLVGHFTVDGQALALAVLSFSFRQGLPREADLVFDVRFLDNPHWVPELRPLTGRDQPVAEMIQTDKDFATFFGSLTTLLNTTLPRYESEGKSYLTIAIGCTGGRHRSVFTAERLAVFLREGGYRVSLRHRELGLADE